MRLIKRLDAAEERAAAASAERTDQARICWSTAEERVSDLDLSPGDFVACDVHYEGEAGAAGEMPPCLHLVERITRDERDLGVVYDPEGVRVGVVVALDGSLLTLRADRAAVGGAGE